MFDDNQVVQQLTGEQNSHLKIIEKQLGVRIHQRGNQFTLHGERAIVELGMRLLKELALLIGKGYPLYGSDIVYAARILKGGKPAGGPDTVPPELTLSRPQVNGTLVILNGRSEPGSTVTVNGETADVDASGTFKKVISFERQGVNVVTVRAVDGAGNETVRRETVMIEVY